MIYSYLLFLSLYLINATNAQYNLGNGKAVGAGLWYYKYTDVASECTNFLGPNGYSYVQVAPIQSSIKWTDPVNPARNYAWWNVYQPLSYNINSRFGTSAEFQSMVTTCRNAGVDVVVDVVLNHAVTINKNGVGGFGSTTPWNSAAFAESFPDFGYTASDFNDGACNGDINDYNNDYEVV
jgi:alpha-amylase